MKRKILNSKGQPILLNDIEQRKADYNQRIANALGHEIDITTLTTIVKKVIEQKFFQVAPADYLPIKVGEGAWNTQLTTFRSFNLGDDFSTGILNTGGNNTRMASADVGVDSLAIKILNWAKTISWSLFDLQYATQSGNWDLVTAKERARKKNWDLGIQSLAFKGIPGDSSCLGLLNQAGVNTNTTVITKAIKAMSATEYKTFSASLIDAYRANCVRTAWPTHFIIPESDYLGLAAFTSTDYPLKSTLEVLTDTLKTITQNPNFKILPLSYCDVAHNVAGTTQQQYVLLNYDEDSVRMDIPVDYTNTLANTINGFNFENVGYGQFTGVLAYRPLELLYFKYTP